MSDSNVGGEPRSSLGLAERDDALYVRKAPLTNLILAAELGDVGDSMEYGDWVPRRPENRAR